MKKSNIFVILILSLIIISLVGCLIYQKKHYSKIINGESDIANRYKNREYYCSFTKTYRVVDLLDDYIAEMPEWSYVILDRYNDHEAIAHKIPTRIKNELKENKYYEFKYTILGNGNIKTMEDINKHIVLDDIILNSSVYNGKDARIILYVKETNKQGLEQIQENICNGIENNIEIK